MEMSLPFRQQVFILIVGLFFTVLVFELIRRRRLLEQYSVFWFLFALLNLCFVFLFPFVVEVTQFIGAGETSSTILFFGLLLSLLIILQLCVKISELTHKVKDVTQELAVLRKHMHDMQSSPSADSADSSPVSDSP